MRQMLGRIRAELTIFSQKHRPILIFGLRRGGSTMVSDAVWANRGVWFTNEPFAVLPVHPEYELKRRALPQAEHSHFFALQGDALAKFEAYSRDILAARHRGLGRCRRPLPPNNANRVCMKILNAPWMVSWFEENTDAHVLRLLRHPASQALSVMRQGWDYPVTAYARRTEDIAEAFSADQTAAIHDVLAEGDPWKTALLDWIVTSRPLRAPVAGRAPVTLYEDIVRDPARFVDEVCVADWGLADRAAMLATISQPSGSSKMSEAGTKASIQEGDVEAVVNAWRRKTDDDMRRAGQRLLDLFEVAEYSFGD